MHDIIVSNCLCCNKKLSMTTAVADDDPRPTEGDLTVCLYCSHIMAFGPNLSLRALTDAEIIEAAGDPDIIRAVRETGRIRAENERGARNEGDY